MEVKVGTLNVGTMTGKGRELAKMMVKAVGPDDILVEVWKCLGEIALEFLTRLYNRTMESERMPEEWRDSILIPIFKDKGDVQSCSNYRGIKLISHSMKLWERVVERRLRSELTFSEQQYGFMPGKSTTDALFALRVLMEKYREGQKELHCVFVDLEKAYDKVPREEVWYCVRKSGLAEKYVRIYTTIGDACVCVCVCKIGPISARTFSFRHQTSRKFFSHSTFPIPYLWTAFCVPLSFVFYEKQ